MSLSILAPILVAGFLFAIQGFLLQTAVALTGDPAPRYFPALGTALHRWRGLVPRRLGVELDLRLVLLVL